MGPNLLPCRQPIPNLAFIHEWLTDISSSLLPLIGFSDEIGNQELDAKKSVLPQDWKRMFENIFESIVER
jgi:hypothetical protein